MIINLTVHNNIIISPDYIIHPKCSEDLVSLNKITSVLQQYTTITHFTFRNELCSIRLPNSTDTHKVIILRI